MKLLRFFLLLAVAVSLRLVAQPAAVLADPTTGVIFRPTTLNLTTTAVALPSVSGFATNSNIIDALHLSAWGDSFTYGTGATTSYPTRLGTLSGYAIYNGGSPGDSSTDIKNRFIAAADKYGETVVIWAGRNDNPYPDTVKANIATMVAALTHNRYFILSIFNGNYSGEYAGGGDYDRIIALNNDLATIYGNHYLDVRAYVVSLYDPNIAQDVIDHGHDVPPSSLRADALHLNDAGYQAVANYIYANRGYLQGTTGPVLVDNNLITAFMAPPTIGGTTAGKGYFTTINATGITTIADAGMNFSGGGSFYNDGFLHIKGETTNYNGVIISGTAVAIGTTANSTAVATFSSAGLQLGSGGTSVASIKRSAVTWDPPSLADGASTDGYVTGFTGLSASDVIQVSFPFGSGGWLASGHVINSATVQVTITNKTGGTVDLASGTLVAVATSF